MKTAYAGIFLVALLTTQAAAFSQTEFHLQYGKHKNPFSAATQQTFVFTVQQAAGWKLGDSFFFIDYLNDDARDGFNDRDFYGEWYPTLSFGKLANKELRVGIEYQYWLNKLGTDIDESTAQLLVVWRL